MEYKQLGSSGLRVSVLGFGSRHLRWPRPRLRRLGQHGCAGGAAKLVDICLDSKHHALRHRGRLLGGGLGGGPGPGREGPSATR